MGGYPHDINKRSQDEGNAEATRCGIAVKMASRWRGSGDVTHDRYQGFVVAFLVRRADLRFEEIAREQEQEY